MNFSSNILFNPTCTGNKNIWAVALCLLLSACSTPKSPTINATPASAPAFSPSKWEMLPDWQSLNLSMSHLAFLQSCRVLKSRSDWSEVCGRAETFNANDNRALRAFYEEWFTPYQVFNADGTEEGIITGYYEPWMCRKNNSTGCSTQNSSRPFKAATPAPSPASMSARL